MRKMILLITMVVLSLSTVMAQVKDGKLIFERKINMHKMITDPEMRRNIPEFRSEKFELVFNEQATVFKTLPNEDAPDPFANSGAPGSSGSRGMGFMFRMPETNTYTDIASQMQYEARSIFENEYLIIDTLKPNSWKLSDETKTIANYVCKKATTSVAPMAFTMRFGGGDRRGAEIVDLILREEIGHVAIGNYWYRWLCAQRGVDPVTQYAALATTYRAPKLKGPFNVQARLAAGFEPEEIAALQRQ
jgi:GLPGLI family protein